MRYSVPAFLGLAAGFVTTMAATIWLFDEPWYIVILWPIAFYVLPTILAIGAFRLQRLAVWLLCIDVILLLPFAFVALAGADPGPAVAFPFVSLAALLAIGRGHPQGARVAP